MNFNVIKKIVKQSLIDLYEQDSILLRNDACERSITHRLAICIEKRIAELNNNEVSHLSVDCEYNRNVAGGFNAPKYLIIESEDEIKKLNEFGRQSEEALEISSYPDIIVHQRGTNDYNLLVIEVKKISSRISVSHDIKKLKAFTKKDECNEYGYSFGVLIKLDTRDLDGNQPICEWYSKGRQKAVKQNIM